MKKGWKDMALDSIRENRVCDEYEELTRRAGSKIEALNLYKRGIDWCLEHNSPSIEILRHFRTDCAANGVYIDCEFHGELLNDSQVYVFHHCTGTVRVGLNLERRIIPMLYFANGCTMTVEGQSPIRVCVPIYIFGDDNRIVAEDSDEITTKIFRK